MTVDTKHNFVEVELINKSYESGNNYQNNCHDDNSNACNVSNKKTKILCSILLFFTYLIVITFVGLSLWGMRAYNDTIMVECGKEYDYQGLLLDEPIYNNATNIWYLYFDMYNYKNILVSSNYPVIIDYQEYYSYGKFIPGNFYPLYRDCDYSGHGYTFEQTYKEILEYPGLTTIFMILFIISFLVLLVLVISTIGGLFCSYQKECDNDYQGYNDA